MEFKTFIENEEKKNINATLAVIPKSHMKLVKGFSYKFQPHNTLNNDGENVGELDPQKKKITVAAPWHYGREFTVLHEIGHSVYETLSKSQIAQWDKLAQKLKKDPKRETQDQCAEELFCMAYANTYAKHKDKIHDHPEWEKFILTIK